MSGWVLRKGRLGVGFGDDSYLCGGVVDCEGDGFEAGDEVEDAAACGG